MSGSARGARSRRPVSRLGVALSVAVLGAGAWFGMNSWRQNSAGLAALPLAEGRIAVSGIGAIVEIYRDSRGVPHIEASSEADAHFGWGFAHAQDRLAQMLWMLASARGRTAAIVGSEGLAADRWARTLGLGALADAQFTRLDGRTRALLVSYAAGINARIQRIRAGRVAPPVALRGAELPADLWQPADSLALLKLYSWGLADSIEVSLVLRDISARLGSRDAIPFFPRVGGASAFPALGARAAAAGAGPPRHTVPPTASERSMAPVSVGLAQLRAGVGLDGAHIGSSAWVVAGWRTESGYPILAADSHLEATAPAVLHIAHVHAGDFDVAGAALPGVPVFWTGHNRSVAWASTHAQASAIDLYEETLGRTDEDRYHDGRRWGPLGHRVERIAVAGGDEELLDVRSTRHGPLIDGLLDAESEALSLAWVGARDDVNSAITSLGGVARADNAEALLRALAAHHEPSLAVAYADKHGVAGVQVAAWIPRRALRTDLVPLPGRARWYDWSGRVAFARLPRRVLRGGRGWAIASDNPIASYRDDDEIDWLWRPGARADRIDALLRAELERGPIDLRGMAALQADVGLHRAPALVAVALELAGPTESLSVEARDVARLLRDWDGASGPESVGAAVYHVFIERLAEEIFERVIGAELTARYRALPRVDVGAVVFGFLRAVGGGEGAGNLDFDATRASVRNSLRGTWLRLSYRLGANRAKWRWGRLHRLSFRPFGARAAASLEGLTELPLGGSRSSIAAAEFRGSESFAVRVASTFRMVVDVGSLDQALAAIAPGQSEHPAHPHYRDGLDAWLAGRSSLLLTDRLVVRESGAERLVLDPIQRAARER